MKKWFKAILGIIAFIILIIAVFILLEETDTAVVEKYVRNENLTTVKADWQGTPVDQKGRFVNVEHPFLPSVIDLLKWQLSGNPQAEEKKNDRQRLEVFDPTEFLQSEKEGILWLGHAGFFVRLGGKSILLDPVFGDPPFIDPYLDVPSPLDKIRHVDYVLISHDHRDHTDEESIKQIARKFPNAEFLVGLRMDELIKDWINGSNRVQTAGWYQRFSIPDDNLKIYFLPVRHWSRRGLFDTNERLWGGFVIESGETSIYFSGDSGFGSHYKEVGELFPDIDYFLIGIGAYKPRWFMKPNHNTPEEAFQAFVDAGAKYLVPMHFGRFEMSDEPPSEPLRLLKEKAAEANASDKIKPLNIYESIVF